MKKLIAMVLTAVFCCVTLPVRADGTTNGSVQDPPAVELVYGVHKGEAAPYTGVLLSIDAGATIIAEHKRVLESVSVETERVRREMQAQRDFDVSNERTQADRQKAILAAQVEAERQKNDALLKQLALVDKKKTPRKKIWTVVGVVAGVVIVTTVGYGVVRVLK